jgi:hypothetical protein
MAATTSFKQQCPSCEAMVPIRDPGLIGRKIDCPKCKYRFVVEKPKGRDDDEDEDAPRKGKRPNGTVAPGRPGARGAPAKTRPSPRRDE